MILVLVGIFTVAFFISFVLVTNKGLRVVASLISFIALIASLTLMIQNDKYHFGMEKEAVTTSRTVYTALPKKTPVDLLMYQPVGASGEENVFIYKTTPDAKKASHTQTDGKTTNCVFYANQSKATLETTTIRYKYKSTWSKLLFGLGDNETVISRNNTFTLPKNDWLKISTANAKKLASVAKSQTPAEKAAQATAGKEFVMAQVKAAIMADPKLATDPAGQAKVVNKATAAFEKMVFSKLVKQLEK